MQFTNKRIVKNVWKGTKNLMALNIYVYTLKQEDWIVIAELLQNSNKAIIEKKSTWILIEKSKMNARIFRALTRYFSYRFKKNENNEIKIFKRGDIEYYKVQQHTEPN